MFWNIYKLRIFSWIDKSIVDEIISKSETRKYKTGSLIITEKEASNGEWYIVKKWNVEISINAKRIAELWIWDIVWEIALLSEEERTASVKAITDIEVIVLNLDNLIKIIDNWNSNINKIVIERIEKNLEL